MAEENQVTKELQQIMKEPQGEAAQVQQVTTKNPKKVEAGKRLLRAIVRREKRRKEKDNQNKPIDFINNQLRLERKAETKFTELNKVMREFHEVFGHELPPLPQEPVLSNFYTPTNDQHYQELGFIALSMIGIGGVLYYLES